MAEPEARFEGRQGIGLDLVLIAGWFAVFFWAFSIFVLCGIALFAYLGGRGWDSDSNPDGAD